MQGPWVHPRLDVLRDVGWLIEIPAIGSLTLANAPRRRIASLCSQIFNDFWETLRFWCRRALRCWPWLWCRAQRTSWCDTPSCYCGRRRYCCGRTRLATGAQQPCDPAARQEIPRNIRRRARHLRPMIFTGPDRSAEPIGEVDLLWAIAVHVVAGRRARRLCHQVIDGALAPALYRRGWRLTILALLVSSAAAAVFLLNAFGLVIR